MKKSKLIFIIDEEINALLTKEDISSSDDSKIRKIIRDEVASIFFDLFKRKASWK